MKRCTHCKQEKELSEFNKNKHRRDGVSTNCKDCNKKINKKHYQDNKAKYLADNKSRRHNRRVFTKAAKNKPCADCGRSYPYYVMEFDHREGERKIGNLSRLHERVVRYETLVAEIEKCDVVCANCHRERTHQRTLRSSTG